MSTSFPSINKFQILDLIPAERFFPTQQATIDKIGGFPSIFCQSGERILVDTAVLIIESKTYYWTRVHLRQKQTTRTCQQVKK